MLAAAGENLKPWLVLHRLISVSLGSVAMALDFIAIISGCAFTTTPV